MEEQQIENGCLEWVPSEKDFDYSDIGSLSLNSLKDVDIVFPSFNQWNHKETKSACTIVNSTRALLALIQVRHKVKYSQEQIDKFMFDAVRYCVEKSNYTIGQGRYVPSAMKFVMKRWNENNPDKEVWYVLVPYTHEDFAEILKRGYPLVGSYRGSYEYNSDYKKDWVLDGEIYPNPVYWHCTDRAYAETAIVVNDSYAWSSFNVYKLKYPVKLIENKVWNPNFYLWFNNEETKDNSAEIKRLTEWKNKLDQSIELDQRFYTNTKQPNVLEREKFQNEMNIHANLLREKKKAVLEALSHL